MFVIIVIISRGRQHAPLTTTYVNTNGIDILLRTTTQTSLTLSRRYGCLSMLTDKWPFETKDLATGLR